MSDQFSASFTGAQGPVFTGHVDQPVVVHHNQTFNQTFIPRGGELVEDSKGRSPRVAADDYLTWLYERFVPPQGFGTAWEILEGKRTVLLAGRPGSGRGCAARMLLRKLRSDVGTCHELLPENDSMTWFAPGIVGSSHWTGCRVGSLTNSNYGW